MIVTSGRWEIMKLLMCSPHQKCGCVSVPHVILWTGMSLFGLKEEFLNMHLLLGLIPAHVTY